jgi:hypothetical protein
MRMRLDDGSHKNRNRGEQRMFTAATLDSHARLTTKIGDSDSMRKKNQLTFA